jgi:methionyl-tRNA formyltransferase
VTTRVVFLGNDVWSTPPLESLAATPTLDVVLVVTDPPHGARRGSERVPSPVAVCARRLGLDVLEIERVGGADGIEALRGARPAALAVVAYGELLSQEVLASAPLGSVNLHLSLLPRWRGAAPVQRAILAGDIETGATVMLMDEGLDTGPILATLREDVSADDDSGSLGERLARLGGPLLATSIVALATGSAEITEQIGEVSMAPKLSKEERWIDWREPATATARRVRALNPEPGASTRWDGRVLKVFASAVVDGAWGSEAPGTIVSSDEEGIVVATGEGFLRPLDVAAEGRRRLSAVAWARGARPLVGLRLG